MLIKYVIDAEPAAPVIPHCGIKKYPEMQIATNPKNEETGEIVFISMGWGIVCSFCSIVTIILTTVTTIHDARFLIYVISVILIYSFSSLLVRKNKGKIFLDYFRLNKDAFFCFLGRKVLRF